MSFQNTSKVHIIKMEGLDADLENIELENIGDDDDDYEDDTPEDDLEWDNRHEETSFGGNDDSFSNIRALIHGDETSFDDREMIEGEEFIKSLYTETEFDKITVIKKNGKFWVSLKKELGKLLNLKRKPKFYEIEEDGKLKGYTGKKLSKYLGKRIISSMENLKERLKVLQLEKEKLENENNNLKGKEEERIRLTNENERLTHENEILENRFRQAVREKDEEISEIRERRTTTTGQRNQDDEDKINKILRDKELLILDYNHELMQKNEIINQNREKIEEQGKLIEDFMNAFSSSTSELNRQQRVFSNIESSMKAKLKQCIHVKHMYMNRGY